MVLTKDRSSEKLIAVVDHNNIKETYECSMSICPNPSCTCGIVGLTFIPVHGEDRKDNTASSITVKINIEKQSLADDDSISQEEYDFGKELFNQLQKEDFALLEQEQIAYKRRIVQDDELTSLNIEFPIKDIELEGLMFGYNEILPYEKSLAFSLDGHDYAVLDQYCLRPQCSCTEAVLSFYLIDGGIRSGKESFDYLTDYKKRTWDYVKESIYKENIPDMITVRNAIEQQEPDIYEELQKRHRHLKILYTNWRKRRGPTQQNLPISRKAVGRNEPCPCGSGKKYKKCCGRV